jgi:hypothetical protein
VEAGATLARTGTVPVSVWNSVSNRPDAARGPEQMNGASGRRDRRADPARIAAPAHASRGELR